MFRVDTVLSYCRNIFTDSALQVSVLSFLSLCSSLSFSLTIYSLLPYLFLFQSFCSLFLYFALFSSLYLSHSFSFFFYLLLISLSLSSISTALSLSHTHTHSLYLSLSISHTLSLFYVDLKDLIN